MELKTTQTPKKTNMNKNRRDSTIVKTKVKKNKLNIKQVDVYKYIYIYIYLFIYLFMYIDLDTDANIDVNIDTN